MKVTKYGHACLMVEDGEARLLIDPGSFSRGYEGAGPFTAVLYTHQHADHYDKDKLAALLEAQPDLVIVADHGTADLLREEGHEVKVLGDGDKFELAGVTIEGVGSDHAVIHETLGRIPNTGYLVAGRFFFPGDALTDPGRPVDVLALPVEAPWTKVGEVIDYLLEVKPRLALPAHESVSAVPEMQYGMIGQAARRAGITWITPEPGAATGVYGADLGRSTGFGKNIGKSPKNPSTTP